MKTKDYVYGVIIALLLVTMLNIQDNFNKLNNKVDSPPSSAEIKQDTCMPVTISGAGTQDLRADVNLKFDVAVCENELGQAVINNNYDVFVNDMIAENEEWK